MAEKTALKYMQSSHLLEDQAMVVDCVVLEDGRSALILDQTVFYPQGGGQPYDRGSIKHDGALFDVQEVRFKDGIVYHIGTITAGSFDKSLPVDLCVDKKRRILNSQLHTAGHIVDIALHKLGMKLTPYKGYHFPDGAYIEYMETIDDEGARQALKNTLQAEVDLLVNCHIPIHIKMVELEQLQTMAQYIPENIPTNKPMRAMIVEGFPAIPCGGTHVEKTDNVGAIVIDKIRNVKGHLRVSYSIH